MKTQKKSLGGGGEQRVGTGKLQGSNTLHGAMKLGCRRPRKDYRTLKMRTYLREGMQKGTLVAPEQFVNWDSNVRFGMFENDVIGDCTCAAAAHMVQRWCANTGRVCKITSREVIAAYSKVSGYDPLTGKHDVGADPLDVLNLWRREGIGGHRILAYTEVNLKNFVEVQWVIQHFGGIYYAVDLPVLAQDQQVWDLADQAVKEAEAGSWGGHMVSSGRYYPGYLRFATWGDTKAATPQWAVTYGFAGYAVVSEEWLDARGATPDGFDLTRLRDDLAVVEELKREQAA